MKTTAGLFKSLADETRLRLLLLLQDQTELCVCDLLNALNMPQSTVSRHLAYLKKGGWLQDRRGGIWMYYSLADTLDPFQQALLQIIGTNFAASRLCQEDQQRLHAYRADKDQPACPDKEFEPTS